jgi:hypothetical protein
MSDEMFMQIAHTLAGLDRRVARIEVAEAPASSGSAGTASMTASEILTAIKTVDGASSGLDADLLDGLHGAAYSGTAHTHSEYAPTFGIQHPNPPGTASAPGTAATPARIDHIHAYRVSYADMPSINEGDDGKVWGRAAGAGPGSTTLLGGSALIAIIGTADGTGSTLDADFLDGSHASAFSGTAHTHTAYSGTAHTHSTYVETASYTASDVLAKLLTVDGTASLLDADKLDGLEGAAYSGTAHTHTAYAGTADVLRRDGSLGLTGAWDAGAYNVTIGSALIVGGAIDTIGTATALTLNQGGTTVLSSSRTGDSFLTLGQGRIGSAYAYVEMVGDETYPDFGLRLIRYNSGANTLSRLIHRGTGALSIEATEAAALILKTTDLARVTVASGGEVGIGAAPTAGAEVLQVTGDEKITGYLSIQETANVPGTALLGTGNEMNIFMKADKFCIQFKDSGGTVRYLSMDLTGTGTTWVHGTAVP